MSGAAWLIVGAIGLMAAAAPAVAVPTAEAEALGMRLAKAGSLAAMLPAIGRRDIGEMLAAHPDYTPAEKKMLIDTAVEVGHANAAKLLAAIGHGYAETLSVEDLRALVATEESPAARRWREAEPAVIADASKAVGGIDYKRDVLAAFCKKTGKACKG